MKLPNDLIKATDYKKTKDREIHEFECVNGKFIHHYVLGGEHELTNQEIVDCLNALATIDCDLQTAYAYIKGQNEELSITEKALELACETIKQMCGKPLWIGGNIPSPEPKDGKYFKDIAKEMIKNE